MNTDSSFGQIIDLPSPFKVEHAQVKPIADILFKQPLDTQTSIEAVVIDSSEEISSKKKEEGIQVPSWQFRKKIHSSKFFFQIGFEEEQFISVQRSSHYFVHPNTCTKV